MIVLRNMTKVMKTYNLDRHHSQIRKFPRINTLANGQGLATTVKLKIVDSITFLGRETKSKWRDGQPIPESMLNCPDIKSAIASGELQQVLKIVDRSRYVAKETSPHSSPSSTFVSGGGRRRNKKSKSESKESSQEKRSDQ